ncbi:TonB-dependent receptor [Parasphingorhabdus sp.]|uniref:TonB-dependent receptor n=1 Tax=Parasphingorhabdus sp. TaxID=2709688 RepID=UPI0030034FA6
MMKNFTGTSIVAIAVVIATGQAQAQTPANQEYGEADAELAQPQSGLDEIVVTARRRAESAQTVPISITAFSGEDLASQSAVKVNDVSRLTPNLFIGPPGSAPGGLVIGIRGQVQTDTIATLDPSVGIYVDGVYWARAQGANADLLDIERVEVLKGPQGTLFGRNSTGGALNITTANPDTTSFSGVLQGRIGNFGQLDAMAVLNIPLVEDELAVRFAANKVNNDGFYRNTFLDTRLREDDTYTVRGKLLANIGPSLKMVVSYEHFDLGQAGNFTRLISSLPFPSAPEFQALIETGGSLTFGQFASPADFYGAPLNVDSIETANTDTASLTLEYELGGATAKYIGSYRSVDSDTGTYDYDGTPINVLTPRNFNSTSQWTHELQLNGETFDDRFNYTLGGFLFREDGRDGGFTLSLPAINPNNPSETDGTIKTRSWAVFGQGTFRFTDAFSFTGGLRYSEDRKELDLRSRANGVCSLSVGTPPVRIAPTAECLVHQERKDSSVSYLASLEYRVSDAILTYAKTSKGYRAGGFNLRGTTPGTYGPFAPENVTDYEVGLKSEFLDRRVRLNVAAFYSDYSDIQRGVLVPNGVGGVATSTINAGKAEIKGLEVELTARPLEGLELGATLGITDAKYKEFLSSCPVPFPTTAVVPCVNGTLDRSGEEFERTPKYTYSVTGSYTHPVPLGSATIRADYSFRSRTVQVGLTQTITPAAVPFISQEGFGLLNARLSWDIENPDLSLAVYGRNLTKTEYYAYQLDLASAGLGYYQGSPGIPRQYGLEATFRF